MKNLIASLTISAFCIVAFVGTGFSGNLKEKCNKGYRVCLKECKKKYKGKEAFLCQGECGKKKQDCRKNARAGKKYSWKKSK